MSVNPRLKYFVSNLEKYKIDAYLIPHSVNIQYLTRFPSEDSWLFVSRKGAFYITDARYTLEAKKGLKGVKVTLHLGSLSAAFGKLVRQTKAKRIGFDERHVSLKTYRQIQKSCPKGARLVAKAGLIEVLREIKEKEEIKRIKSCLRLQFKAIDFLKGVIKPGLTERDVLLRLEKYVKSRKAGFSFDPIVASGPNSCFPHAKITDRKIRNNEPVLVDFGIDLGGYKSDLTRMFFLGKIPPHVQKANEIVAQAQQKAAEKIRPGAKAKDIDQAARGYLKKQRLDKYFGHSLGHGVGLEIHEAPWISQKSSSILKENMIFTLEPAVYIPNKFGIRIEDMVLVTQDGCDILSR